ncbi:MAG: hypothetical protein EZS28_006671 [Streblomastix strix]|uniref:Uncharacterized protein n=1 Tax=Streblomastix strix TaxID=222440 RepID=A0A5J4WSA8_9EUKA|nr:MAG: hypothetical protein EZS28_006671 [Streblomastix strix]
MEALLGGLVTSKPNRASGFRTAQAVQCGLHLYWNTHNLGQYTLRKMPRRQILQTMTLLKCRVITQTFNVERQKFYLLAEDCLDKSLQRGRKQNASTTVEVRVYRVEALNSVTKASDDLNFVIHAFLIYGPLYGYQIAAFRRMEVSN